MPAGNALRLTTFEDVNLVVEHDAAPEGSVESRFVAVDLVWIIPHDPIP